MCVLILVEVSYRWSVSAPKVECVRQGLTHSCTHIDECIIEFNVNNKTPKFSALEGKCNTSVRHIYYVFVTYFIGRYRLYAYPLRP